MEQIIYGVVLVLYLSVMLGIGLYFYRRSKSQTDYFLGGRNLNVWVTSMSAQASDMSGWLLMGLPGTAFLLTYKNGMAEAFWTALGLAVGTYLNWLLLAKRLRNYSEKAGNSITIPTFLENRFRDKTSLIRTIAAIFIVIFFLIYTAAQFSAGAKLFNAVFGIEYQVALIIGACVIVLYTFLGGFSAVCWTDLIQGILMFFALILLTGPVAAILAGLLLTAILAAIMSTADSQLLVTSSAISEDIGKKLFGNKVNDKNAIWISRLSVIVIAVIAVIIASNPDSSVFDLVSYAWAGFGAAFGPAILLSLYWKRMNWQGALAGIVSGGLTVLIWRNYIKEFINLYELLPAFIVSVIFIIAISLLTKKPGYDIMEEYSEFIKAESE